MKLFQIVWSIGVFILGGGLIGMLVSTILALKSDDLGKYLKPFIVSALLIVFAFIIGLIGLALWILGV